MNFEKKASFAEAFGEKLGYVFSYFLFTTILFFILSWLNKLPESLTYYHIMAIIAIISGIGVLLERTQ
ncbi:MAG: hypothetical protein QW331_04170 [Candidatus Woesearchaeota archaeon]